jgi:hypothetical protein
MSFNHAIAVSTARLTERLQRLAVGGNADAAMLLDRLTRDPPISQNTDLFKYVLEDNSRFSFVQRLLMDELETGNAAVYDAATADFLSQILLKRRNSSSVATREFLADGARVLWSLDCIVD